MPLISSLMPVRQVHIGLLLINRINRV